MTGGPESYGARGIIPRVLSQLFAGFAEDPTTNYTVSISYLEIYNETGYDLLNPVRESSALEDLPRVLLQESETGAVLLKNLSGHPANSEEEALNLLFLGDTTRMIAETPMNEASSRSHCIFTVTVTGAAHGSDLVRHSKLHLVDLAGSERVGKTNAAGQILKEAKHINLSLHYLEQVIVALHERASKGRSHIPYRNSMMTSVLRDSLGGNCMTTMIATLNMDTSCLMESISTCRFASRVAQITNTVRINEELNPDIIIKRLRTQVQHLKEELALATGRDADRGPITESERARVAAAVKAYIQDPSPDASLPFVEMVLIRHAYAVFKDIASSSSPSASASSALLQSHKTGVENTSPPSDPQLEAKYRKLRALLKQRDAEIEILMGMVEKQGSSTSNTTATTTTATATQTPPLAFLASQSLADASAAPPPDVGRPSSTEQASSRPTSAAPPREMTREEAFEVFKASYPNTEWLSSNQEILKAKYGEAKGLGQEVNDLRETINGLKALIEQLRVERAMQGLLHSEDSGPAEAPEEAKLKADVDRHKAKYKKAFYKLKDLRKEIEHLQLLMEKNRVQMSKDFEVYYLTLQARAQAQTAASSPATSSPAASSPAATPSPPRQLVLPKTGDAEADDEIARYQALRQKLLDANTLRQ